MAHDSQVIGDARACETTNVPEFIPSSAPSRGFAATVNEKGRREASMIYILDGNFWMPKTAMSDTKGA